MANVATHKYLLKRIDRDLWKRAQERAEREGRPIRFVLLELLKVYAEHGFQVVETFDGHHHRKKR